MKDHRALIQALQAPQCYPHAVQAIRVLETPISTVLLTGAYVYKLKKPVRLDFVDFSTLERRRYFCHEELRLNRRYAPALYLDVVAITGSIEAPRVDGDGEPIEYAVKLRQFDPREQLSALITEDRIEPEALRRFGMQLASVQATHPVRPGPSRLWATIQANLRELGGVPAVLEQWLSTQHVRLRDLLDRRGAAGSIRDCHGDLHANNAVRWEGELMAFDCIEFDPALREIDVADDAAFLMMDLLAHGRRDLAYAFVNGWLEVSGDYEAARALPWFRAHRALVRAKVARLDGDEQRAEMYLRTALRESLPAHPTLILMCGLSGSGKTWVSTRLIAQRGGLRVRSDVERKRLAGLQPHESSCSRPGEGIYTRAFNDRVYDRLLDCARTVLESGELAIVDAAFLRREERARFIALAKTLGVPVTIVHCHAADSELRARLQARVGDASEATPEVLTRQYRYWEAFTADEKPHVIEVDTQAAASLTQLLARLPAAT
jgi:aminoglycoside phosphotransferase family enzyme/predicted kinase